MKRDPGEPSPLNPRPQDARAENSEPDLLSTLTLEGEARVVASSPAPPATGPAPCGDMNGENISRYVVQRCLGQGAMGAVYAAWDPQLGREIALKLLHGDGADRSDEHSRMRLQREARAIARLSHPHVVAVHDVGTHGDEVFVAMELVDGGTLRTWLAEQPRSWREILEVFVAAGRGLQAAHAAGLVHRDFKPDNVLIGKDGRVRVADFGLARAAQEEETAPLTLGSPSSEAAMDPLDMPLTHSGAIVGTPMYMAPEQFQGSAVDARTDQFSFCVALYLALYGAFPFGEGDLRALAVRVVMGRLKPPPRKSSVPSWIAPVILRGLAAAPEKRFPSMEELLRALDRRPDDRRNRWGGGVAVGVILLGVALGYGYRGGQRPQGGQTQPRKAPQYRRLTTVGDAKEVAISPDGKTLAYVSGLSGLVIRRLETSEEREAYNNGHSIYGLRWSPDNTRLLFAGWEPLGGQGIWMLSGRDLQQTELTPVRDGSGRAVWSPDGLEIARADPQNKQVVVTNWKNGTKRSIHVDGTYSWIYNIDWSWASDRLLVHTRHQDQYALWSIRPDGRQQELIVEGSTIGSPGWSPQGRHIFFFRENQDTVDLMKVGIDSTTGRLAVSPAALLTGLDKNIFSPISLTQDGRKLVYTKDDTYGNLWLLTIESQGRQRISRTMRLTSGTVGKGWPVLSPDGQTMAFSAREGGSVNLFTLAASGGETRPRQLTFFRSWDSQIGVPAWSPDGKEIAFVSGEGGALRVWRIPATGGPPKPFPRSEPSESRSLTWAPGAQILYQRPRFRNFQFLDPVTEEERPLLAHETTGSIHYPRYSPDGKRLAVWWDRAEEGPFLRVISLTDGAQIKIAPSTFSIDPRPVGWSADGQWIYAVRRAPGGNEILRFPSAGGAPERWVTATFARDAICPSMTPDGRRFVCMVDEGQADAWQIEDFDAPPDQPSR